MFLGRVVGGGLGRGYCRFYFSLCFVGLVFFGYSGRLS